MPRAKTNANSKRRRDLLAAEISLGSPGDAGGGGIPAAVCYPNGYRVAMASLGHQLVWGMFRAHGAFAVDRFFDAAGGRGGNAAGPHYGLERGTPLRDALVIAFSLYYEPDYVAAYRMLAANGVRPWAVERGEFDPFIIFGGPAVTANAEPMAPFADAIVLGDAESSLPRVLDVLADATARSRDEIYADMAAIPGVYVPALYRATLGAPGTLARLSAVRAGVPAVRADVVADLSPYRGASWIATPYAEFGKTVLVEPIRGCGRRCSFCEMPLISPPRRRGVGSLWPAVDQARTEVAKAGLVGAALADYAEMGELVEGLRARRFRITASSLSLSAPATATLIRGIGASGTRSIALAPEGATPEAQTRYGKAVPLGRLEEYVAVADDAGITRVKLYYIIGADGEGDEDVRAIGRELAALARRFKRIRFEGHVNPLVPKKGTAFAAAPLVSRAAFRSKLALVKENARGAAVTAGSWREAEFQTAVGRGDRGTARWLARLAERIPGTAGGV